MMAGWIKLHRQVREHWLYTEERTFSRYEAWIDLLMMANYKDAVVLLGNEKILVKRGSFITSEMKLAQRWKWGKTKVRNFLKLLQEDQMIVKETDHKKTTITICNYSVYNDTGEENKPVTNHEQTTNEPPTNREQTADELRAYTTKKDKNNKNDIDRDDEPKPAAFETIANHFLRKRNSGFYLSPKDEMAIQQSLRMGIPVPDILACIDDTFARVGSISSFSYIQKVLESQQRRKKVTPIRNARDTSTGYRRRKSNLEVLEEIKKEWGLA